MKISLISGIGKRQVQTSGPSNLIGSLDWAERTGIKLSNSQKITIGLKQGNPLASLARGIVRELISGNRGGIADMLYAISPFNTGGKRDSNLENQYGAAVKEIRTIAQQKFPIQAQSYTVAERNELKKKYPAVNPVFYAFVEHPNFKANTEFVNTESKKAYTKFPYLIYPPANDSSKNKYRELEISWLNNGGDVDSLNSAVKEGITKSPRNKTFNYLLGKFAAKRYFPKDLGLAIRAVVGAGLGGDRFSFTDGDIFNPWKNRIGTGKIGSIPINGPGVETAVTTLAVTTSAAFWVPILTVFMNLVLAGLAGVLISWAANKLNPQPEVAEFQPGTTPGAQSGGTDLTSLIIPVGAAVAGYLLFFSDDNK